MSKVETEQDTSSETTQQPNMFLMYDVWSDEWVYVTPEEFAERTLKLWQGERRSASI